MTPNAGSSADASRSPSDGELGAPAASCTPKIAAKAPARAMKLQGSASRTAATNASSPSPPHERDGAAFEGEEES